MWNCSNKHKIIVCLMLKFRVHLQKNPDVLDVFFSYQYLTKATEQQFDSYYLECTINYDF